MIERPVRCPVCGKPYSYGTTYCDNCKLELSQVKRNYCLNPKCSQHNVYLLTRLAECPACGGPTANAEEINRYT